MIESFNGNFNEMGFLGLFLTASMPVLKVLLITGLGACLALDRVDILGPGARKHVNELVFWVFNPAVVSSNLAKTVTFQSIVKLWYMPVNMLLTFTIGSIFGWILVMITRTPPHLKGLVVGSCAGGNLGYLLLIIIPATCQEKGSPFGNPDVCYEYGMAYASLSLALGAIFMWTYVYNLMRVFSRKPIETGNVKDKNSLFEIKSTMEKTSEQEHTESIAETTEKVQETLTEQQHSTADIAIELTLPSNTVKRVTTVTKMKECFGKISRRINLKAMLAPSTIGALAGFAIGTAAPVKKLFIGSSAPLRVIYDCAYLLGDAAIPCVTLIMGGNLLRGLRGSGIQMPIIIGIIIVRYIILPICGVLIVKGAVRAGLVHSDPLYQFVLHIQFAVPPAMNIGTIAQLFDAGASECSVIMLWLYGLASVSLTLWSTLFMWLVS